MRKICEIYIIFLLICGCSLSSGTRKKIRKLLENKDYIAAQKIILNNEKLLTGKDKFIYNLDLGVAYSLAGDYNNSNKHLEETNSIYDDFLQKPMEEIMAFLVNPNIATYKGEIHEALFINYFKAWNYIQQNDLEKALIECKRINNKHLIFLDKMDNKSGFSGDAFMNLFMGVLYHANEDYNNAFIAYRNSLKMYEDIYIPLFKIKPPKQLLKDLIFSAYMCGFTKEMNFYKKKYKLEEYLPEEEEEMYETIIFYHSDFAPIKTSTEFDFVSVPGAGGAIILMNENLNLAIPFPYSSNDEKDSILNMKFIRIAFPKYVKSKNIFKQITICADNKVFEMEKVEDLEQISFQILEDRIKWEITKTLIRVAAKQVAQYLISKNNEGLGFAMGIFNIVSEGADERCCQALPKEIFYLKIKSKEKIENLSYKINYIKNRHTRDSNSIKLISISNKTQIGLIIA